MLRISTAAPGKGSSADLTLPAPPVPAVTGTGPKTTDGVVTSGVDHPLQISPQSSDGAVSATPIVSTTSIVDRESEDAPPTGVLANPATGLPAA